jgi:type II secretory pathway pseudopilin PulG
MPMGHPERSEGSGWGKDAITVVRSTIARSQILHSAQDERQGQRGFTLAGVLVILTVLSVVVAYTVPPAWSQILKRDREIQTIWVMKQYARAIYEFQRKRNALPVSMEQLEEQNTPRVLRALYPDPLTGKMDWILVPPGTPGTGSPAPGMPAAPQTGTSLPASGSASTSPGDYRGPFIGVRPPITGQSYITLNGVDRYENWLYTLAELQQEISRVGGLPVGTPQPQQKPRQ